MSVVLRPLTERDVHVSEAWFAEPKTRRRLGDATWPRRLLALAREPGRYAFAALEGEAFVAIADAEREGERAAVALVVAPEQRRRGLGRAVLAALREHHALSELDLLAGVEDGNDAATALVLGAGFEPLSADPDEEGFRYFLLRA
jgi:GNAT superfamily N-acetyltransferase